MILTIAKREYSNLFLSPFAWIVISIVQVILSLFFFIKIIDFFEYQKELTTLKNAPGVTELIITPFFNFSSIVLLIVIPLFTMRALSEEKRNKTFTLLLSAPVSITEIVLGKYLGLILFVSTIILLLSFMPFSLIMGTDLDYVTVVSGATGLFILVSAYSASGVYLSSLTDNPLIAAVSTFGLFLLLLLLWIISLTPVGSVGDAMKYIPLHSHFTPMTTGIINTSDIAYFVLFIISFLVLTIRQLETQRLQA